MFVTIAFVVGVAVGIVITGVGVTIWAEEMGERGYV